MNDKQKTTIGEIAAADYRTAAVFNRYGLDFCCNGNRTVEDACLQKGIASENVKKELEEVMKSIPAEDATVDYGSWPLDMLADHIERKHHGYVKAQLPIIANYLEKICSVHGDKHPELKEIRSLFNASATELSGHMHKEEQMLFPYIRQMAGMAKGKAGKVTALFGTVQSPIQVMTHEHDAEGQRFRTMRELSHNYIIPPDGCNTYRAAFAVLDAFEEDLHLHIHLENNILFPKAIELEQNLFA